MGRGMIQLVSVVVRASRVGLMCAGVAVTSAVSISLGGESLTATSTTLPVHCAIKPPDGGAPNVLW